MARGDLELRLRLSPAMKKAILAAAKEANRSINAEVVLRLQFSLEAGAVPARGPPAETGADVRALLRDWLHDGLRRLDSGG